MSSPPPVLPEVLRSSLLHRTILARTQRKAVADVVRAVAKTHSRLRAQIILSLGRYGDIASAMSSPEVAAVVVTTQQQAERLLRDSVIRAWAAGKSLARSHLRQELRLLGTSADVTTAVEETILNALIGDVSANVSAFYGRLTAFLFKDGITTYHAVDRALADMERRIAASVAVAMNRAYTETQLSVLRGRGMRKVWVTAHHANTCDQCASLDGKTIAFENEFTSEGSKTFYGDGQGPPLHPGCLCRIVAASA